MTIKQKQSKDLKIGDIIDVWWSTNSINHNGKNYRQIREIKPYRLGILVFEPDGKEMSLEADVFDVLCR